MKSDISFPNAFPLVIMYQSYIYFVNLIDRPLLHSTSNLLGGRSRVQYLNKHKIVMHVLNKSIT